MKYHTILADPPWRYSSAGPKPPQFKNDGTLQRGCDVSKLYPTMAIDEICALPVGEVAEKDAHLYLWVTNTFMEQSYKIARAWGFKPTTILTWGKVHKTDPGKPSMKMGYYYRSATEHILFCVKGKQRLIGPAAPTLFLAPRLPHSVKPECSYEMIEQQSPGPYLELFARRPRAGWDVWGNEVDSTPNFPVAV